MTCLSLNQEQLDAMHYGDVQGNSFRAGPLLIIAGAGTGKTNTLAHRVAHLIVNSVAPERILVMTFSRRAANEVAGRVQRIVAANKQSAGKLTWMGTFHSIANNLLREYAGHIGLESSFVILDRSDATDMLDLIRHQLGFSASHSRFPRKTTCLDIYSRVVNAQQPLKQVLHEHFPWCAKWEGELTELFKQYSKEKIQQACLDYDDLLLYLSLMAQQPEIAAQIRAKFEHVLIDEYQDTNKLQQAIVLSLFGDGNGVTVVGDDAQSIYSFRCADVDNILNFPKQFSQPVKVISLSKNYRSTQAILDCSNALLNESAEGYKINLQSQTGEGLRPNLVTVESDVEQAEFVCESVLKAREQGIPLRRQAVLFRSAHHSDRLEVELTRRDIPYVKYGGLKFLESSHIKDLLCIMRWADNPKHRLSGFRVLKLLPGVGPKTAEKILDFLTLHHFDFSALGQFSGLSERSDAWKKLQVLLPEIHNHRIHWSEQVKQCASWYQPILEQNYDDAFVRFGDIEQLIQLSQQSPNRESFLAELTLDPPSSTSDLAGSPHLDDDFLILSTVHSAKGQEWQHVHILNVADGNFPNEYACGNDRAIEEERRLLYVAMTRAKQQLTLIQPLKYWVPEQTKFGDKHVYGAKSRFLTEGVCDYLSPSFYPLSQDPKLMSQKGQSAIMNIRETILAQW